jgi:hypothetical protein
MSLLGLFRHGQPELEDWKLISAGYSAVG